MRFVDSQPVRVAASIWIWMWVGIFALLCNILALLLIVPFNPWLDARRRIMDRVNQVWARGILFMLPRIWIENEGVERLRNAQRPFVIVANHQSVADIIVLLGAWAHMKFVAKRKLFNVPLLAAHMRLAGYIQQFERRDGAEGDTVLPDALKWLAKGVNVIFFPEGGRSTDGQVSRFHRGPFLLARRAGVQVLPIAIWNTGKVLPKGTWKYSIDLNVKVSVLEPIDPSGEPKDVARLARDRIREALGQAAVGRAVAVEPASPPGGEQVQHGV